jgi:hypothetical protein
VVVQRDQARAVGDAEPRQQALRRARVLRRDDGRALELLDEAA